jgi:hypothetical protein
VSRTLGDFRYKDPAREPHRQKVSPVPEIMMHTRSERDQVRLSLLMGDSQVSHTLALCVCGDVPAAYSQVSQSPRPLVSQPLCAVGSTFSNVPVLTAPGVFHPCTWQFLVLACDGIWDVATDVGVGEEVQRAITVDPTLSLQALAKSIVDETEARQSTDNMSVLLVAFPAFPQPAAASS